MYDSLPAHLSKTDTGWGKRIYFFFVLVISLFLSDSAVFAHGRRSADKAGPRGKRKGDSDT